MYSKALSILYNIFYHTFTCIYAMITFTYTVLPLGVELGLLGVAAYHFTKLKKPNPRNVLSIFGPDPRDVPKVGIEKEGKKVVQCIAHRGAALDAPENTLEAFKYCVEKECNFIEMDVRSLKDGKLVLLHDPGLERLAQCDINDVRAIDWDFIKDIDIGAKHPNRNNFKVVRPCLLDDALDYLLENKVRMILDVKGRDMEVINGIVNTFKRRPELHNCAAVTCFNPLVLYQIRRQDPEIVGAISYRPYCFSATNYDAESGPTIPRVNDNIALQYCLHGVDLLHAALWRSTARWCGVSCVLLHKDIVSLSEVTYWHSLGVRCIGWSVNRPLDKLYWRGVLRAPYLANTLLGEPDIGKFEVKSTGNLDELNVGSIVDKILSQNQAKDKKYNII